MTILAGTQGTLWGDAFLLNPCDELGNAGLPPLPPHAATGFIAPFVVPAQEVGINHTRSVPDALTGRRGLSLAGFNVFVAAEPDVAGTVQVQSRCGEDILTGLSDLMVNDVTTVESPLMHFGICQVQSAFVTLDDVNFPIPPTAFAAAGIYPVGNSQPAIGSPPIQTWGDLIDSMREGPRQDLPDVLGVLGGTPIPGGCLSLVGLPQDTVFDERWFSCGTSATNVTMQAVPGAPGGVLFTTGLFANPDGQYAPEPGAFADKSAFVPLFFAGLFPCGPGQVAYTACPQQDSGKDTGSFVVAGLQFMDPVSLSAPPPVTIEAVDTGLQWSLIADGDELKVESSQPTAARAIVRGGSVTFAVDQAEAGPQGFTWRLGDGTRMPLPLTGTLLTPSVPAGSPAPAPGEVEDLTTFLDRISASIAAGDAAFAFDRLHPFVLDAFGEEACRAKRSVPNPGFRIELVGSTGAMPWTWELPDGRTVDVPEAEFVDARITQNGATTPTVLHLVVIDGQYRWFTFC